MAVGKRNATKPLVTDMIVENHEGLPILLVEVKARKADSRTINQVTNYMRYFQTLLPREADLPTLYAMIVDPERIEVFVWDGNQLTCPVFSAEAGLILGYYSAYYGSRSHPESGCILNRLPRNPRYFSVNSWMIVNISYDRYLSSRTVVDFGSCEVFSMVFV